MKKFEYKTIVYKPAGKWVHAIRINSSELEETLNELGAEGWELISITHYEMGGDTQKIICIFKREKI